VCRDIGELEKYRQDNGFLGRGLRFGPPDYHAGVIRLNLWNIVLNFDVVTNIFAGPGGRTV
jgi:hypothetical protein